MKRIVAKGFVWVVGTMALVRAVRYLSLLLLGGVLAPADFGGFAAIFVLVNAFALLQGFGLGQALLLRRLRVEDASDTIFWLSLALGLAFFVLAWVSAPLVELVFGERGLAGPYRLCALLVFFRAVQTVPSRLFEKDLAFRKQFMPGLVGSIVYAATALTLAARGAGVWALVSAEVAAALGEAGVFWAQSPWRPRFRFDRVLAREDLKFGWVVLGGTILVFLYQGIDRVAIDRALGRHELGLYAFVFTLASLPASYAARALNTVLLPSYASQAAGGADKKALYLRATSYAAALGIPFVIGILALGRRFLESAYADKWLGGVGAFYVLALLGLFQSFSSLSEDLLIGLGRPSLFRTVAALRLGIAAAVVWLGARWGGITGVALAMTLAVLVPCLWAWSRALALLGASAAEFAKGLVGPLLAGALVGALALVVRLVLPPGTGLLGVLAAGAALALTYFIVWISIDRDARSEFRRLANSDAATRTRPGSAA